MSVRRRGATSAVVLHGHLPYIHEPDHEAFLEEDWLFEAIAESYLPLLGALDRLAADRIPVRLTVGFTPPLMEMLRSQSLQAKAEAWLLSRRELSEEEVRRHSADPERLSSARHYLERFQANLDLWRRHEGDLLAAYRGHLEAGRLEIMASSATHAVLPLCATDAGRRAQIRIGRTLCEEVFGVPPAGFWLPECAYTPGLSTLLGEEGVRWIILEHHALEMAHPEPADGLFRPIALPGGVAAFGRDPTSGRQVWAKEVGYPGDPWYRERYRDLGFDAPYGHVRRWLHSDGVRRDLGIKYHRVTGEVDLADKALWNAERARERSVEHARHFAEERARQLASPRPPANVLSAYDWELFGHWWYEGPLFLEELARALAPRRDGSGLAVRPCTPSEVLGDGGPIPAAEAPLSTWGRNGHLDVWVNAENLEVLRHQQEIERRMVAHVDAFREPTPTEAELLDAMGRQLLLLQSSDWAFILTHRTSTHYARLRVAEHASRFLEFERALLGDGGPSAERSQEIARRDAIFPGLDHRVWRGEAAARQGARLGTLGAGLEGA